MTAASPRRLAPHLVGPARPGGRSRRATRRCSSPRWPLLPPRLSHPLRPRPGLRAVGRHAPDRGPGLAGAADAVPASCLPLLLIYYLSCRRAAPAGLAPGAVRREAAAARAEPVLADRLVYVLVAAIAAAERERHAAAPHAVRVLERSALGRAGASLPVALVFARRWLGVAIWNETRQRTTARLLGLGALGLLGLALLGISWEPLGQMGTSIFLSPALWFACDPGRPAWVWVARRTTRAPAGPLGLGGGLARRRRRICGARRTGRHRPPGIRDYEPLTFGLGPDREALVAARPPVHDARAPHPLGRPQTAAEGVALVRSAAAG